MKKKKPKAALFKFYSDVRGSLTKPDRSPDVKYEILKQIKFQYNDTLDVNSQKYIDDLLDTFANKIERNEDKMIDLDQTDLIFNNVSERNGAPIVGWIEHFFSGRDCKMVIDIFENIA
jgi:hypothetical protein